MTALAERLKDRYFGDAEHPYRSFEKRVASLLDPSMTLLDVGCGRTAPVLEKYRERARRLIGIDLVEFTTAIPGIELHRRDIGDTGLDAGSVDVVMARSVMEHVTDPVAAYREMHRILRPGGHFVFLTANLWDYASLIAMSVPNRWHPWIVSKVEGREPEDVFPTAYRTNTRRAITSLAGTAGFEVSELRYLGQYPGYFMFNGALFMVATAYEKLLQRYEALGFLRGWILADLKKPLP